MNISTVELLDWLVKASYLVAATLFLLGLQRMASPLTARSGIRWPGWACCWPPRPPSSCPNCITCR